MSERVYISHGGKRADGSVEWFVVRPPNGRAMSDEVMSLRLAGRSVYSLDVRPWRNLRWARRIRSGRSRRAVARIFPFPPFIDRKGKW